MMQTIQIAVGIWLGGLFLIGTVAAYYAVEKKLHYRKRSRWGLS